MRPLIVEVNTSHSPESLCEELGGGRRLVLLRTGLFDDPRASYSFVAADPFLSFQSWGSRCEVSSDPEHSQIQFGNPWHLLDALMARYELLDELDLPFPLGGCFGYWGYDLRDFVEPRLTRNAVNDLELPDCQVGFYDSLIVFDHRLSKTWIVSTGLLEDGSRSPSAARHAVQLWSERLGNSNTSDGDPTHSTDRAPSDLRISSNISRETFLDLVRRAQEYIRSGDIYQVNLSQRLKAEIPLRPWECYRRLADVSPAPFAAFLQGESV